MASEKSVRIFFELSGLDKNYFTIAQSILVGVAECADEEHPDAIDCENVGYAFVTFMVSLYAKRFTDKEMALFILQFQTAAFRKLVATDTDLEPLINDYLQKHVGEVLEIEVTVTSDDSKPPTLLN